jgi:hypothetical protein
VLVELFALSNVAFLAVDIAIAHAINAFANRAEWIPLVVSPVASLLLVAAMLLTRRVTPPVPLRTGPRLTGREHLARSLGLLAGWICVGVGVAGLVLHLESQFFVRRTLASRVYTAPFVAPLAYAGLGLLLILNRMVRPQALEWAQWVTLLAMGGFAGNFVLSLADHAQNGFFVPAEWIGVFAGAFATSGLLLAALLIDLLFHGRNHFSELAEVLKDGAPPGGYLEFFGLSLLLILAAELLLAVVIAGRSVGAYLASRDPVSGGVYIALLVVFAAMPCLLVRRSAPGGAR